MVKKLCFSIIVMILVLVLLYIAMPTVIPVNVFANSNDIDNETVVVRVGYTENYGIIKYPTIEGNEGYGFEYFQKINEYTSTDYEFEYVLCAWSEGLEMLEKGEIDILGPAHFTEERDKIFTYSKNPIGKDMLILTSLNPNYLTESSYQKLNNGTVLIREGDASLVTLQEFFNDNNYNTQIIETDEMDVQSELEKQQYDFLFSGSMQMEVNLNIVMTLGSSDVFLMANNNCQDIIDDFDNAIEKINSNEYMFQEQLYIKYFSHNTIGNEYITDEEYALLQEQEVYNIGVENLYTNIGFTDYTEIAGLYVDIIEFIANKAEINVNFVEINKNSTQAELDMLDFYLPVNILRHMEERTQSNSYMQTPLIIIEAENTSSSTPVTIGVVDYYGLEEDNIKYITNEKNVKIYSNLEDLVDAFVSGELDKIMLTDATYRMSYNVIAHRDHSTKSTTYNIGPKFSFSNDISIEKVEVFDKLISYISNDFVETALLKHVALTNEALYNKAVKTYLKIIFIIIIFGSLAIYQIRLYRKKELEKLSNFDNLTGLLSQHKFFKEMQKLLKHDIENNYTLVTFDIDNFKYINEIYGFDTGTTILKITSNFVKNNITKKLPYARLSNDNFIFLIKNNTKGEQNKHDELQKAISLTSDIHKEFHQYIDKSYFVTFSFGCYDITDLNLDINYMVDNCNLARSYSKEVLGNSLHVFNEEMGEKERTKNSIVSRMNQAVIDKEFVLFYQPKFNIKTQEIVGAEALVRWFVDDKMIPPNDFIPLFEDNGFIETLDYYVIETACEFISKNSSQKLPVISVNLSGVTIMKHDVVTRIISIINKHKISPHSIDIEITESAFVNNFDFAIARIDELRTFGFTISMDDFGVGISSLGRLKDIPLDILKIDREFIIESLENKKADKIFRNIINIAKDLELETVAEGIETVEQLEFLREICCDVGQGYYFSRPLPQKDFLDLLFP